MFSQQQFVKIHLCSKRKGKPLMQLFVWICVCVSLFLFVPLCMCLSLCVCACLSMYLCVSLFVSLRVSMCVFLCVSLCIFVSELSIFKYNAFVLRILLVPVLQRCKKLKVFLATLGLDIKLSAKTQNSLGAIKNWMFAKKWNSIFLVLAMLKQLLVWREIKIFPKNFLFIRRCQNLSEFSKYDKKIFV